jgi:hypothetical protein
MPRLLELDTMLKCDAQENATVFFAVYKEPERQEIFEGSKDEAVEQAKKF